MKQSSLLFLLGLVVATWNPASAEPVGSEGERVVHGVYGLLRSLGFGYTLDGDLPPPPRRGFTFDGWDLADRTLVPRRFVFNWHNFLSGCSAWNLEDWNRWTTQAQKMGYNGIMVHAYGNNPMAGFAFDGVDKPVGYLSSTRLGRDWATMHVNDVRRLVGGEVFDAPVFGATAAIAGTDGERTRAAQALMRDVFAHAGRRGMDVIFALDFDTDSANAQELITRLPESARFESRPGSKFWLANPETPEGYAYYKTQLAHLLTVYPQLDTLVLWFRRSRTPMTSVKAEHLPDGLRKQYNAIVERDPGAAELWSGVGLFLYGRLAAAQQRMLAELGREDVTLGVGSWGFDLMPGADTFLPPVVGVYPLDFEVLWKESRLESPGGPEGVKKVAAHRPVYPIHWAHHDDLTYVGPPYPPFENFHGLLAASGCDTSGFGVLHWTSRPLDLFFVGLSDAVWASSQNQSVQATCDRLAREWVGEEHGVVFGRYLRQWLADLPMIGRDTGDFFIDRELKGYEEALQTHRQRMALLDTIDRATLTPDRRKRIDYFRGLERFILGIHENEAHYRRALTSLKDGEVEAARSAIRKDDVPAVIGDYVKTSDLLGISPGEKGLVVSLNLRWLVHYLALKQRLGIEPIRINFAPTRHDPLAQNRGRFTYFIDEQDRLWEVRGEEETKVPAYGDLAGGLAEQAAGGGAGRAVRRSGIESDQPMRLSVSPLMNRKGEKIAAGRYRLTLLFGEPAGDGGAGEVAIALHLPGEARPVTQTLNLDQAPSSRTFDLHLTEPGVVALLLDPDNGTVRVSGLIFEPLR